MAKNTESNPLQDKIAELDADIATRYDELAKLGDSLRGDPYNVELRNRLQAKKRELIPLTDQVAELQRAVSIMNGGTQHRLPIEPPVTA